MRQKGEAINIGSHHAFAILLATVSLVLGEDIRCTMEKFNSGEHCVFRGVVTADRFTYPADVEKPRQVAFVGCYMKQLPSQLLTLASPELRVLRVESCGLESITITSGLEELYAKDNSIEQVIVQQSGSGGSLRTLDLSGNQLSDVSDMAQFQGLEMLNLSGNKLENVLDLGKFRGLNKLRKLILSHNDINYLDNTGNVNLESLEELDLSHNNLITSDLDISIFYPYTKLHTLRLNNNYLSELDYNFLLNIKLLKTIFLDGNNFNCSYIDVMLKHLQKHDLQTPPGESSSCSGNTLNEFCCLGPLPTTNNLNMFRIADEALIEDRIKFQMSTEQPNIAQELKVSEKEVSEEQVQGVHKEKFWSSWWYVIVGGATVGLAIFVLVIICVVCIKQQKKETNNPVSKNLLSA